VEFQPRRPLPYISRPVFARSLGAGKSSSARRERAKILVSIVSGPATQRRRHPGNAWGKSCPLIDRDTPLRRPIDFVRRDVNSPNSSASSRQVVVDAAAQFFQMVGSSIKRVLRRRESVNLGSDGKFAPVSGIAAGGFSSPYAHRSACRSDRPRCQLAAAADDARTCSIMQITTATFTSSARRSASERA